MKMLENGTENVFTYQDYQNLKVKLKKDRHALFFERDEVVARRLDSRATRLRDPLLHIGTYSIRSLPPYERVLKDIEDAAEHFEREISS